MSKKQLLYVQTSGADRPERLYPPFVLASTAVSMDVDATIYFLGAGLSALKKGEAENIKMGDFPTLKQMMDQAIDCGVKLMVCGQSFQMLGLSDDDLVPEAKVVGAATLNDLVLEADGTMWF